MQIIASNLLLLIPVVIGLVMLSVGLREGDVHGAGLAPALRPSTRESLHAAPLGPVRRIGLGRSDRTKQRASESLSRLRVEES